MQRPKKRLPRIERHDGLVVMEDENQHLWAVSYSDFLMALLAFFILFFSMDTPQRQKIIMQIAGEFKKESKVPGFPEGKEFGNATNTRVPSSLIDQLQTMKIKMIEDKESLLINMPDDFFLPGQYKVDVVNESKIRTVLSTIKPYSHDIILYFEGHADSTPLLVHKNEILVDNFVLSSLRASSMLQYARSLGFSEKQLFIQAASSNLRNSRSLSIRIEPKERSL